MKNIILALTALGFSLSSMPALSVDLKVSGYGSITMGKTIGGEKDAGGEVEYIADFYDVGLYDEGVDFRPESIFAVQGEMKLSGDLSVVAQLVAKGTDDFSPEFDWYYAKYKLTNESSIMAGRRNIPMYYFSEFMEVGFAYPWVRPPSNLYWWQITQFNGVTYSYNFLLGDGDYANTISVFGGGEDSENNKEMTYYNSLGFYGNPDGRVGDADHTDESWENIIGLNWKVSHDYFDVRLSAFTHDFVRDIHYVNNTPANAAHYDASMPEIGKTHYETKQTFIGLGGAIYLSPFTLYFDYNHVSRDDTAKTVYPTYFLSLVYEIGKWQPFIGFSKADHTTQATDDLEEHRLISLGVRYNVLENAALKIQYDNFVDQGDQATGWDYHNDAEHLAISLDFVF
jgi:hypothetical protein